MGIVQKLFNQLFNLQSIRQTKIDKRNNLYSNKQDFLNLIKEIDQRIKELTEEIDDSNQQSDIVIEQIEQILATK
jgi:hypothetical protein